MDWQFIVALIIAIPVVLFVPVLIWVAVTSGLYQVARDALRRRVLARRRTPRASEAIREAPREG